MVICVALIHYTTAQIITTFAGTGYVDAQNGGLGGYNGDGIPATSAQLSFPNSVAVDGSGNLLISDQSNNRVRVVLLNGTIITIAGSSGGWVYNGDGIAATSAQLWSPTGISVDGEGNVFIADTGNQRVRKVFPNGTISTLAGIGTYGYNGDGFAATYAQLYNPIGVAVDGGGNVFIGDSYNNRVRLITPSGIIWTLAGTGVGGYNGDGIMANSAQLFIPTGLAVDAIGNVFIGDTYNYRIRVVFPNGTIATVAGTGSAGYNGDGIPATSAQLSWQWYGAFGIAVDAKGELYIADNGNARIRKVYMNGTIETVAGTGVAGYNGDGLSVAYAWLNHPSGVAVDGSGKMYIADYYNNRIRMVAAPPTASSSAPTPPPAGTSSSSHTSTSSASPTAATSTPSASASVSPFCTPSVFQAFPSNDLVGTLVGAFSMQPSAYSCQLSCCGVPGCEGYTFGSTQLLMGAATGPCFLLANVTQLVPNHFASSGVRARVFTS